MAYDETLAERIRSALDGTPGIEERKMFGGLPFLLHGRMCCGAIGSDLMVRVPLEKFEIALRKAHVRPMDFTGKVMKGYVFVDANVLDTKKKLGFWISLALEYSKIAKASKKKVKKTKSTSKVKPTRKK